MHGVVENPISDLLSGGVFHPHPLFIPYTRSLSACKNMSEIKSERIVKLPSFFLLYFVTAFKKDKLKNLGGKFLSICFWKKKVPEQVEEIPSTTRVGRDIFRTSDLSLFKRLTME